MAIFDKTIDSWNRFAKSDKPVQMAEAIKANQSPFEILLNGSSINPILNGGTGLKGLDSLVNRFTQGGLTSAQKEGAELEYQYARDLRRTQAADEVEGYKDAGINPALMYGSGYSTSTGSVSTPSASPLNISELYELAMLPAQLKLMNAQAKNLDSASNLNDKKAITEEENARLQGLVADWYPAITGEQVAKMSAEIDNMQADINLKKSNKDYIDTQNEVEKVVRYYMPQKLQAEIGHLTAQKAQAAATAAFTNVQYEYAKQNKFLMSSNDTLLVCTYIASLFGIGKSDVEGMISKAFKYIKDEMPLDFRPWSKVDPDDAMSWFLGHRDKK